MGVSIVLILAWDLPLSWRHDQSEKENPNRAGTDARKRKDGRYETRVTLNTPTGRRRMSFYGATAEEANNKKFQALAEQAKGILFSDPGRMTVGEYLQSWLIDTARYQVSEGSFERYERTCHNHLVPFFGRLRLRELTAAHVRAFKARKIEEGLNPNTVGVMQGSLDRAQPGCRRRPDPIQPRQSPEKGRQA
jgi:integrase